MSSYSFQGRSRYWTPRDEEENRAIFSAQKRQNAGNNIPHPNEIKPIYAANVGGESDAEKWSVKHLIRLLRLYGAHSCLWDVRDADNRNRKLRRAALIDITAAMGEGVTYVQVVQKINVLRATYRYEKRRIKQRIRKGVGAKTKLKWFALADVFLRNVPRTEKFRKNEDSADSDSDLEDAVVFSIDPESLLPLDDNDENYALHVEEEEQEQMATPAESDCEMKPIPSACKIEYAELQTAVVGTEGTEIKEEAIVEGATKRAWTQHESLEFVKHLKDYPILWTAQTNIDREAHHVAIENIARQMLLPWQRVAKRVHTFKSAYARENLKIAQNSNYTPNIVWWALAEEFMKFSKVCDEQTKTVLYDGFTEECIKQEIVEDAVDLTPDYACPETPLNPIASVAPASVTVEEAIAELFDGNSHNSNEEACSDDMSTREGSCSPSHAKNNNTTPTKLVWNGLEDDLLEGKWSLKHSVKFLRLYGAHRCLWDLNDADYRSRELRNAAIEDIAAAMGYGLNADYVAKKIKIFRITYMQQRKRMLGAIKAGKEPEIQLRWFPLADSFLRAHIGLRSIKEHECEIPQFDFQYVYANLNLIDPALLNDFRGKGTQNTIDIGNVEPAQERAGQQENISSEISHEEIK